MILKHFINTKSYNNGFSLVELIIVVAIMAILVGVITPMYVMYVESGRESVDIQNMDNAYQLAKAMYVEDPDAYGTFYYYYDGNEIKKGTQPNAYGKGRASNRKHKYDNPCCNLGQYNPAQDYTNRYIIVQFPEAGSGDTIVHVHWSN